jgi:hypothetical protein
VSNFIYDATTIRALSDVITPARLAPYLAESRNDLQAAIDLYVWNIKAAARLYGPLSIFEVTLRNALSREMAHVFGTSDWIDAPSFVALGTTLLNSRPRNAPAGKPPASPTDLLSDITKTRDRVNRELARKSRHGAAGARVRANTDDVIAALDLGYWTKLLNRDVEQHLFIPGLHRAFPHAPRRGKLPDRGPLSNVINGIRTLRNRVMCGLIEKTAGDWIEHHSEFGAGARDRLRPRHYF